MSKNDITGDRLHSRANSKAFDENFDKIFKQQADNSTYGKHIPRCPDCCGVGYVLNPNRIGCVIFCETCDGSGEL